MTFLLIHYKVSPSFVFWSNSSRYFPCLWKGFRRSWFPILLAFEDIKRKQCILSSTFWNSSVYSLFPNEVVSSSAFAEVPVVPVGQFQFIFLGSRGMHAAESGTLLKSLPKLYSSNIVICFGHTFPFSELVTAAATPERSWQNPSEDFAQDFKSSTSAKSMSSSSICWPFISVKT